MTTTLKPATRLAIPADAAVLAEIHAQAFEHPWTQPDLESWLARTDAIAALAQRDGTDIAFGLVLRAGEDLELLTLATTPPHRRSGAARSILEKLDIEATKTSSTRWVLEVAGNNISALKLYEGLGFVEIGVRKGYYPQAGEHVDALVLAAPVGSLAGQGAV